MKKRVCRFAFLLVFVMLIAWLPFDAIKADAASTLLWPVPGHFKLSRGFNSSSHKAMDINDSSVAGANIVAAMDGTVHRKFTCTTKHYGDYHTCNGFGTGLVIKGTDGRYYSYAHMQAGSIPSTLTLKSKVKAGDVLGKVGTTGNSSGPHLHFAIANGKDYATGMLDPELEKYTYTSGTPFTFSKDNTLMKVSDTDAVIALKVTKPSANKLISYGATLYGPDGAVLGTASEKVNIKGETSISLFWTVSKSMGVTLEPGTQYSFTFWANISGVTLTSSKYEFKTTGIPKLTIHSQPESGTIPYGETVCASVSATGEGLRYSWFYMDPGDADWTYDASFTGNSYTFVMGDWCNGRQVYCVISDRYGASVTSKVATYDMPASLYIAQQPKSVCVANGEKATVKVSAMGAGLTYRWYYKDPGMTKFTYTSSFQTNTYSVTMTDARAGRQVLCRVYDKNDNMVQSSKATLSQAVRITKQPTDVCVANGKTAKVTVKAVGDGLTYRWYFKEAGASSYKYTSSFTGNTYSVTMTDARAGRRVLCKVYDKYGNEVQSKSALLSQAVRITKQPGSVTVAKGATAKVTLTAKGDGLEYRWYYKDAGASSYTYTSSFTGNTYSVTMNDARAGRKILCRVYDKYGNVVQSNSVTLKMK